MNKRDKLEKAINHLESQRALLGDATVDAAITGINLQLIALAPSPESQTQRKQVTVLFADVSGFTAMSEMMDAEDVQTTMNALWQQVDRCILDHNGRIDKHIGDAVMALWGVDGAREDDPEQAIRAALKMQTAVYKFAAQQNISFKMRIGLNTGPVLLGEVGTTAEFTAMGDAVNTASRLEHAAPIGGILISHAVYRHVRGVFDVAPQEPLTVKGKTEPLQIYVVNRTKRRTFRTQSRGVEGVETRMVGRDSELRVLQTAWQESVANSQTTLITIIGDAGVGKSRLLYEFEKWLDLQQETITLFRGRSAEQTKGTPYFLLRDLLATHFDIRESDPIADVRRKFEVGVGETLTDKTEMKSHILGQWLGYDFSDSPHIASLRDDAEQLKNRGVLYLTQFWVALGGKRPLIFFLEDIHWADSSSLDAILDILRREPAFPMLVLALTRPSLFEHRPAWRNLGKSNGIQIDGLEFQEPDYHFLTLNPLPSAADRELLTEILKKAPNIPEKLFNLVADRAEGNPFYMEELVKMLIDGRVILPDEEVWQVDMSQLDEAQIPSTLTGVLQARLDGLQADEMATLQRASVIGRMFWDTAVKTLGDDQHQAQLRPLQTREFIYQQKETAFVDTTQYLFKHDLLRDVTYQTVLKKARRLYHGQVAEWLAAAAEANGRGDEYAAVIGEHYQAADKLDKAAVWYGRAGKQAAANFAHERAIHYLTLALNFMPKDEYATRFTLLETREQTNELLGDRNAQIQDIEQLAALASRLGIIEQAKIATRQSRYTGMFTTDYALGISYAQTAVELGRQCGDLGIASEGYNMWGWGVYFSHGHEQYARVQELYKTGLQLAEEVNDQKRVMLSLFSLGTVAITKQDYILGERYLEQALTLSHEFDNRHMEGMCLNNLGQMAYRQGNYTVAQTYNTQSLAFSRKIGKREGEVVSLLNLGEVAYCQGEYIAAKEYIEQALVHINDGDSEVILLLNELGAIALSQINIKTAASHYQQAVAICHDMNMPYFLVECWVGMAKVRLVQGNNESAQRYSQQIVRYLDENPILYQAENPMRTFHFTWEVLVALGKTADADHVLTLAAQVMQEYLDKTGDPAMQEMYLNQPHHKVLWAAWKT